ncbi:hypothetical protein [Flavobacterium sp. MK4S-17]|uniref:hypothetical protein n=1 Tax=Flavobacterium sp. MK4S-17 TaxID=2543737 RepID=UPI001358A288|nr:hypothetical protein [Flavobacterium sp. MK4S-17]
MNGKNTRLTSNILPILLLALLLLISPCKVRKSIQSGLGIPQTEVTNKSQTTLSSTCSDFEVTKTTSVKEKSAGKYLSVIFSGKKWFFHLPYFSKQPALAYSPLSSQAAKIPLYILYQNFKEYL